MKKYWYLTKLWLWIKMHRFFDSYRPNPKFTCPYEGIPPHGFSDAFQVDLGPAMETESNVRALLASQQEPEGVVRKLV